MAATARDVEEFRDNDDEKRSLLRRPKNALPAPVSYRAADRQIDYPFVDDGNNELDEDEGE